MVSILHVVGARPNFMKCDPVIRAMEKADGFDQTLVHTGQHYDENMSKVFFDDLGIRKPDVSLDVRKTVISDQLSVIKKGPNNQQPTTNNSTTRARQIAEIARRFEPVLLEKKPDWVFVYGDVNSTVACARVAKKHGVKLAHVEAGLRSFDETMPEELNRIETDQLADLLFVTEQSGIENLNKEFTTRNTKSTKGKKQIHLVGNTMIDTLIRLLPKARERFSSGFKSQVSGFPQGYALVTMHRPSNVDDPEQLERIMEQLEKVAKDIPVLFPIHPRTEKLLGELRKTIDRGEKTIDYRHKTIDQMAVNGETEGLRSKVSGPGSGLHGLVTMKPLGYLDFLALQANAAVVITDSGGIQEETTFLGVPCLTVRANTERPVTIEKGTNRLCKVGEIHKLVQSGIKRQVKSEKNTPCTLYLAPSTQNRPAIPLWVGKAAERIVEVMKNVGTTNLSLRSKV